MTPGHHAVLATCVLCTSAFAAQPKTSTVDVQVINDESRPVPVTMAPAASSVVCTLNLGFASPPAGVPIVRFSGFRSNLSVACPVGVLKLKVKSIGYSLDIPSGSNNAASFRITAGMMDTPSQPGTTPPPGGILAVLTSGAPVAAVAQDFVIDTLDSSRSIYNSGSVSSGIANLSPTSGGMLFFIGTPVD